MNKSSLGGVSDYPEFYDPNLLIPINRFDSRKKLGIEGPQNFFGIDAWTAYELSWLGKNLFPSRGTLYLSYDASSRNFIESKSLKLYLNSLNNHRFNSKENVVETLKKDLEACVKGDVSVDIFKHPKPFLEESLSIDECASKLPGAEINSLVLETSSQSIKERISCSLFRSLCPVTSQPDWATITIAYSGSQIIHSSLLSYLLSFRNHQGFHEECVEKIFTDIMKRCIPDRLTVQANFLRRGGIEINPVRSSGNNFNEVLREQRQ